MNIWENAVITSNGLSLLSKLIAGNSLTITRAVTGAGYITPGLLQNQTQVSSPKQELSFRDVTYPLEGKCAVPCFLKNDGLATGYTANQVGIYCQDPDEGEILFFIAQATNGNGTVIPSATEMPGYSAEWTFYFEYGAADGVTVTVDPSNTITREIMESFVAGYVDENALRYLGNNVITNVEDDTVENWCAMGSGYSRFNSNGVTISKPSNFGILINFAIGNEVFQLWRTMDRGPTYQRSGNESGWNAPWAQIYDENYKPTLTPGDIGRSVVVGCGLNGVPGWYPVGTIPTGSSTYYTYNVKLSVQGNGGRGSGILDIFTRVEDTVGQLNLETSYIHFTGKTKEIIPEYFAIDASDGDATLYVYCPGKYTRYHFSVISEAYGTSDTGSGDNFMQLKRNYTDNPVLNTNYVSSITTTMVASAEPAEHAETHARGGSDPLSVKDIAFLGLNIISGKSNDTVAKWKALGTGYAYYNLANQITDQHNTYGFLFNYVYNDEVYQLWRSMPNGPTYERAGNTSGWATSWVKNYNANNLPTLAELGAGPSQRSVAIGSSSTAANGWYRVGTIDISAAYTTYSVILAVQSNGTRGTGILQLTIRTDETGGVLNTSDSRLIWLSRDTYMPESYFALDASDGATAVLYVYVNAQYQTYHISVLSEKYGAENVANTEAKRMLKLARNHGEASAVNSVESITQTLISSMANPYFTAGTVELEPGVSPLATGKLHFVYE